MKIVKSTQTNLLKNSQKCIAIEYPMGDKDINGAVIKINGRYPQQGRVVNQKCKELAFVLKGNGKLFIEGNEVVVEKDDLVLLEPGERYYWEGNRLEMFMPCTPAWYPAQHQEVE